MYVISPGLASLFIEVNPYYTQNFLYWFKDSFRASSKILWFFFLVSFVVLHVRVNRFI